ncbi:S41 family peptidase [Parafilimonas sp.]|uniref:S41 family peptidase n=1 Tax=Parafilimonas sp. TaxID=1969739 RepID=UPI0039E728F7
MARKKLQVWLPLIFSVVMAAGMMIGYQLRAKTTGGNSFLQNNNVSPLQEVMGLIKNKYVDNVNTDSLEEPAITGVLNRLDPHSVYIPAQDLQALNEDLQGNFQGIGIEFQVINDTVNVMNVIPDGPSFKAGVQIGDKIISVNDTVNLTGKDIGTADIRKQLRGEDGSAVTIGIVRGSEPKKIKITRGVIPLYSLDAAYMLDSVTGYIKLNKFAETTYREFMQAMEKLHAQHIQQLVLDLRENGGGIMQQAVNIADEFLSDDKLIVYTQGEHSPRADYRCSKDGVFEKGRLVVLVDETSASASEILAGALQDWDRATIVGRRTFGKGLVQQQFNLSDRSALRLTIARYYTPLGRNIQKPYDKGREQYEQELMNRYHDGELLVGDTSKPAGQAFKTPSGHLVYGGGGITPDIFVPYDTSSQPRKVIQLFTNGTLRNFVYNYYIGHRDQLQQFKSPGELMKKYALGENEWKQLQNFALRDSVDIKNLEASAKTFVMQQMQNLLARQIWRNEGYYEFANASDPVIKKALEVLK